MKSSNGIWWANMQHSLAPGGVPQRSTNITIRRLTNTTSRAMTIWNPSCHRDSLSRHCQAPTFATTQLITDCSLPLRLSGPRSYISGSSVATYWPILCPTPSHQCDWPPPIDPFQVNATRHIDRSPASATGRAKTCRSGSLRLFTPAYAAPLRPAAPRRSIPYLAMRPSVPRQFCFGHCDRLGLNEL